MKKILSVLLCLTLLLPVVMTFDSFAATYGDLTYKITNGEVTITDCRENAEDITIPSEIEGYPVTEIGGSAFEGCDSLRSIKIGDSVTTIGESAFEGCESLTSVEIPDSVTTIGIQAFAYCNGLLSIEIPDSVTTIGAYAFCDCDSLTSIGIPDSVTTIGDDAFYNCDSLTIIEIPDSVTTIGAYVFYSCDSLSSIEIPDSVTTIGRYALCNCYGLKDIYYGGSEEDWEKVRKGSYWDYECGKYTMYFAEDTPKHSHDFSDWKTVKKATASAEGKKERTCEECGYTETEKIPKLDAGVDPEFGYPPDLPSTGGIDTAHKFSTSWTIDKEATCTAEGEKSKHCLDAGCDERTDVTKISKKAHDFSDWEIIKKATASAEGKKERTCEECGYTETAKMPKTEDKEDFDIDTISMTIYNDKTASFDEEEFYDVYYDSVDEELLGIEIISLPSEDEGILYFDYNKEDEEEVSVNDIFGYDKEPSIGGLSFVPEEDFYGKVTICYKGYYASKKYYYGKIVIEVKSRVHIHEWKSGYTIDKEATCTASGEKSRHCKTNTCKERTDIVTISPKGHDFSSDWTIDIEPTCTKAGEKSHHCENCYAKDKITVVPANGHKYSSPKTVLEPTCTEPGKTERICSVCKDVSVREISATGHDFDKEYTVDTEPTCVNDGEQSRHCSNCNERTDKKILPGKGHSFSEWETVKAATHNSSGLKKRVCGMCGKNEDIIVPQLEYDPEDKNYAKINFTTVNALDSAVLGKVEIQIYTENGVSYQLTTDEGGKGTLILPVGSFNASVRKSGFEAKNGKLTIPPGQYNLMLGLVKLGEEVIETKFEVKEMELEEIIAAGIDIKNPANQHVWEYELHLEFLPDDYELKIHFNSNGEYVGYHSSKPNPNPGQGSTPGTGSGTNPGTGSGTNPDHNPTSKPKPDTGSKPGPIPLPDGGELYPVSENFYLIYHGRIGWLKEMYDVEMLVINNSLSDSFREVKAELSVPDGLSLAEMVKGKGEQSFLQNLDKIDSGDSHSFHWYLKGDKEGEYMVKATLDGKLTAVSDANSGFVMTDQEGNEVILFAEDYHRDYILENPIIVYAGSAMHMTIYAPEACYYGEDYTVKVELENVSHKPIYGLTHEILNVTQGKRVYWSNGKVEEEVFLDEGLDFKEEIPVFNPGDKMILELNSNILFRSDMINMQLNSFLAQIDGIEHIMKCYEAWSSSVASIYTANGYFVEILKNIEGVIKNEKDSDKKAAYKLLSGAIKSLYDEFKLSDEDAVSVITKMRIHKIYDDIKRGAADKGLLEKMTLERILAFNEKIEDVKNDKNTSYSEIFSSLRAAVEALPIRFILDKVYIITLNGSTTEIPYSVVVTPDKSPSKAKIANLGAYMKSIVSESHGALELSLSGKVFDGVYDLKDEIKFDEETLLSVNAPTGETKIKAYLESEGGMFELSSMTTGAKVEGGVLTFAGDGVIEVKALSVGKGVLKIEEGTGKAKTVRTVDLYAVEKHDCGGDSWEYVLAPSGDECGYIVKKCNTCSDILDIKKEYITEWKNPFSDVAIDDWFYESVMNAFVGKYMLGTTDSTFAPYEKVTRGMFVTLFYRMSGEKAVNTDVPFTDVPSDAYYKEAVAWASESGVTMGVSEDMFAPDALVTREQMATMITRYVKAKGFKVALNENAELTYIDKDDISDYATSSILWALASGIMKGNADGTFAPLASATRAELATVFVRVGNILKR